MASPKLTAEETKEIVELFEGGTSCKEIAELYERKYATIWALLKREGLLKKDKSEEESKGTKKEALTFDARRSALNTAQKNTQNPSIKDMPLCGIKRGQIYYVVKEPVVGDEMEAGRPAVVVSNNQQNACSGFITVVFLTTKPKKDMPTHTTIYSSGVKSTALCEHISDVSISRLTRYCGVCSNEEMKRINIAMAYALDLDTKDTSVSTNANSNASDLGAEPSVNYQQIVFERDTYKKLYEGLIEKILEG